VKDLDVDVLGPRVSEEMQTRGPWTTELAVGLIRGFYHFAQHGILLDERAYAEMREVDPGLPEWRDFLALLDASEYRACVVTESVE